MGEKTNDYSKNKVIRRSKMNRRLEKKLVVVYSNVQGYTGKKDSVTEIAETLGCDVLLLTETIAEFTLSDHLVIATTKTHV